MFFAKAVFQFWNVLKEAEPFLIAQFRGLSAKKLPGRILIMLADEQCRFQGLSSKNTFLPKEEATINCPLFFLEAASGANSVSTNFESKLKIESCKGNETSYFSKIRSN